MLVLHFILATYMTCSVFNALAKYCNGKEKYPTDLAIHLTAFIAYIFIVKGM